MRSINPICYSNQDAMGSVIKDIESNRSKEVVSRSKVRLSKNT